MRTGIEVRLRAIRDAVRRHDPRGYAVHHLTPAARIRYDNWRGDCDRAAVQMGDDPAARYMAILDGAADPHPMPAEVAQALGIDRAAGGIPAGTPLHEIADMYRKMLEGA